MNVSDAIDTKNNFCVTPGWGSFRLARPLLASGRYRSYVKMLPAVDDPTVYLGDVYIINQDGKEIMGVMQAMKFRRYPRVLLNRFFSPADVKNPVSASSSGDTGGSTMTTRTSGVTATTKAVLPRAVTAPVPTRPAPEEQAGPGTGPDSAAVPDHSTTTATADVAAKAGAPVQPQAPAGQADADATAGEDSVAAQALALVAAEATIELSELQDSALRTSASTA